MIGMCRSIIRDVDIAGLHCHWARRKPISRRSDGGKCVDDSALLGSGPRPTVVSNGFRQKMTIEGDR